MRRSGFLAMESSILAGATPVGGPVIDARRSQRRGFISAQDRHARPISPPNVPVPVRESAFAVLQRYLFGWQIDPRWGQAGNKFNRAQSFIAMTFAMPQNAGSLRRAQAPRPMRPRPRYTKVLPYPRPGRLDLPATYGPLGV